MHRPGSADALTCTDRFGQDLAISRVLAGLSNRHTIRDSMAHPYGPFAQPPAWAVEQALDELGEDASDEELDARTWKIIEESDQPYRPCEGWRPDHSSIGALGGPGSQPCGRAAVGSVRHGGRSTGIASATSTMFATSRNVILCGDGQETAWPCCLTADRVPRTQNSTHGILGGGREWRAHLRVGMHVRR
jgi:hypothetical protein